MPNTRDFEGKTTQDALDLAVAQTGEIGRAHV
jgi:hypothetical protein